jgi:DNA sulfur modification protein DndE
MGTFKILQKALKKLKTENGWIVIPDNFANYGTDYKTRAGIALIGLGGIWRQDVLYPTAFHDGDGKPLDGANRYLLHFEEGQTPPTNVTWSVSMYDPQGYYVPNTINRYHLAAWMPLKHNTDGSLDLHIQAAPPGADKEPNWLPAPAAGPFSLTVRIYWPADEVLDGTYKLPPVTSIGESRGKEQRS